MGVAVLYPRDCLKDNLPHLISPPILKTPRYSNSNRANRAQSNRRKQSPSRSNYTSPPTQATAVAVEAPKTASKNLVMGQVKILKRGEEVINRSPVRPSEAVKKENKGDSDLGSTDRLGPGPELVPTQIRLADSNRLAAFYAGSSAFVASPPPSSLPLPAFFTKKSVSISNVDATSDLRRILRLDMA